MTAFGTFSERVAADWFDRVEARAEGDVASGGFERLAALLMLLVAATAVFAGLIESLEPSSREGAVPCSWLVEREADAYGTTWAACVDVPSALAPPTGVARLVGGERIDLNAAPAVWLEALPGIGPARAEAIVAARRAAPFRSVRELERVPGIGPVTRARLAAFVEVVDEAEGSDGAG